VIGNQVEEVAATTIKVEEVGRVVAIGKMRMSSHLGICCFGNLDGQIIGTTVVRDLADVIAVAAAEVAMRTVIERIIGVVAEEMIRAAGREMIVGGATIRASGERIEMIVVRNQNPAAGVPLMTVRNRNPAAGVRAAGVGAGRRVAVRKRVGVEVALIALERHLQIIGARINVMATRRVRAVRRQLKHSWVS